MDDIAARAGVTQEVWDLSQVLAEHLWEGEYVPGIGDTGDYVIDPRRLAQIILNAGYTSPTPPADDVREALVKRLADEVEYRVRTAVALSKGGHGIGAQVTDGRASVPVILAPFEVRPRGTVTDAEVNSPMLLGLKEWSDAIAKHYGADTVVLELVMPNGARLKTDNHA